MPSPSPASPPPAVPWFRLSPAARLGIVAAVLAGILLFGILWLGQRAADGDAGVAGGLPSADGRTPAPLPVPGSRDAGGIGMAPPGDASRAPRGGVPIPQPQPPAAAPSPTPPPVAPETPVRSATAPVPTHMPPPRYPVSALRRGETGEVRVRITVGADGRPSDVSVERSSGSRDLDRAALSAARAWRFTPARRDGVAVDDTVIVPIAFDSRR